MVIVATIAVLLRAFPVRHFADRLLWTRLALLQRGALGFISNSMECGLQHRDGIHFAAVSNHSASSWQRCKRLIEVIFPTVLVHVSRLSLIKDVTLNTKIMTCT